MKIKLMSIGIGIGIILTVSVLTLSSFTGQESAGKYLSMKTYEYGGGDDSKIVIVYESGQAEEIPLEKWRISNVTPNIQKINETINMLSKKGYRLVSSTGDMTSGHYIFEKK